MWFVTVQWLCVSTFSSGLQSYLLDKYQTGVSDQAIIHSCIYKYFCVPLKGTCTCILYTHSLPPCLSLSLSIQGDVVDIQENVVRHVPVDPSQDGPAPDGPVYDGPVQILGPGFAPFKPYLRPRFFYIRVSGYSSTVCIYTSPLLCAYV